MSDVTRIVGGLALEPDGRIVVAGYYTGQSPTVFSLSRFLAAEPPARGL